jgi:predicted chitinase
VYSDNYGGLGNGDAASKDGWIYRGRGFNGLTGRGNYKKYGDIVGKNILNNPDLVNQDLSLAAEILVQFLVVQKKKKGSYTQFKTTREAILKFADLNNGGTPNNTQREKALKAERHFKIVG